MSEGAGKKRSDMPPHKNTKIHIGSDGALEPGLWGGKGDIVKEGVREMKTR